MAKNILIVDDEISILTSLSGVLKDEGAGIHPEDMDKLFLPHFSRKKTGSGLGLAIVHRIIKDHNGLIQIASREPKGTVVVI
ncbi:MAG TPA: ATP-binding protein, partial [Nitrospiria bacterium]